MKGLVVILVLWIAAAAVLFVSPRGSAPGFAAAVGVVVGVGILIALVTSAGR
jgi:hypothetical protein